MARQIRIRKTRRTRFSSLLSVLTVLGLMVFMATPAFAHHKADHDKGQGNTNAAGAVSDHDGDADSSSSTAYTEDNDTNDGSTPNNVADEGDNAHPSGKDRSVESGGSGVQGKSESNPDDSKGPMRYEGVIGDDKPNGPGGTDLADQDGNNGCGNDDDFDDDNNGWCGKPEVAPSPFPEILPDVEVIDHPGLEPQDDDTVGGRTDDSEPKPTVLGKIVRSAAPKTAAAPASTGGAALPFTGGAIVAFVIAGLGLIGTGAASLKLKK